VTNTSILSRTVLEISWSIGQSFAIDRGRLSLTYFWSQASKFRIAKFGLRKLETSFYIVWLKEYFDILNRLGVTYECKRQTDGQSSGWTDGGQTFP